MSKQIKALKQLNKASDLANRAYHKNGPKSYKKGQGALIKVLHRNDGEMTSRELVDCLGYDRSKLKDIVRKAQRNEFVTMEGSDQKKTYVVKLTDKGEEIAEKRCQAHTETASKIMETVTDEEIAQLNAITEKIILQSKEMGAHGKHKKGKKHHGKKCSCKKH